MNIIVTEYGAVGNGVTNDTAAIQKALDDCASSGGGRVTIPCGKTFLTNSLQLRSHTELYLENGSCLLATGDLDGYLRPDQPPVEDSMKHVGTPVLGKPSYVYLYANGAEDVKVTGFGRIDGNGKAFVHRVSPYYVTGEFYPRPTLVYFENCRHITFRDVTMGDVSFWTLHIAGCYDVLMQGLHILNPLDVANSDGIDVDHSQQVRIIGCHVECADDCLCMKNTKGNREYPHTQHVVISGCTLVSTSAAIKFGTEGVDDFEDVIVSDCIVSRSNRGISIQIRDGGCVRNVSFNNIIVQTRRFADSWWGCAEPIAITAFDRDENTNGGSIENIRFFNITCEGENGAVVYGMPGRIRDLEFDHVQITLKETSKWPKHRYDLRPTNVVEGILERPSVPFLLHGVEGVVLHKVRTRGFDGALNAAEHVVLEDCQAVERD